MVSGGRGARGANRCSPHQPVSRRSWVPAALGWCLAQGLAWWTEVGSEPITESSLWLFRTLPNNSRAPEPELHSSKAVPLHPSAFLGPTRCPRHSAGLRGLILSLGTRLGCLSDPRRRGISQLARQGDSAPLRRVSRGSSICDLELSALQVHVHQHP